MKSKKDEMGIFFTSDTHFGHTNVIKYCNRPFSDVHEMNKELTDRWNAVVGPRDDVYHLGDFSLSKSKPRTFVEMLNGRIHLIQGNHDKKVNNQGFASVQHYKELTWEDRKFVLLHYPMLTWNKARYGAIHLFGHVHGLFTVQKGRKTIEGRNSMDVGVDCHDYAPISIEDVIRIIEDEKEADGFWHGPSSKDRDD